MHLQTPPFVSGTALSLHLVTARMDNPGGFASVNIKCTCLGSGGNIGLPWQALRNESRRAGW
jgi:hypothetical protein